MQTLFPIYIRNSYLQTAGVCQLKYFRESIQHLSNDTKSHHLVAGGIFAAGVEIVRKSYFNKNLTIEESVEFGQEHILTAEDTGDSLKSNERLANVLGKYFHKYPLDRTIKPCLLADGTHAIEYRFMFDLGIPHPDIPGQNLIWQGTLDGLYEKTLASGQTKRYIVDEKTCSSLLRLSGTKIVDIEKECNAFRTNSQFLGYSKAARLLGIKTDGLLIYKIPILTKHEDAVELSIPFTEYEIDLWYNKFISDLNELVEKYKFYKSKECNPAEVFKPVFNGSLCNSWGTPCQFMSGCLSKDGEAILASSFQQIVNASSDNIGIPLDEYKLSLGVS